MTELVAGKPHRSGARRALSQRLRKLADRLDGTTPTTLSKAYSHSGPRPKDLPAPGDLERIFWDNTDATVHKWQHYFDIYERHFSNFRGRPVRMLEIGVSRGGSLEMWRRYFGPDAVIFGIDIDPECAQFDGQAGQVRIGSQADTDFLGRVIGEMGGVDIVLDDGSHMMEHIRVSLDYLYPRLAQNGVYAVEDLHTAYWASFGGGYKAPESFFELVKVLIDDMHHWYHAEGEKVEATAGAVTGLHIYDSLVVLDKARVTQPFHTKTGKG